MWYLEPHVRSSRGEFFKFYLYFVLYTIIYRPRLVIEFLRVFSFYDVKREKIINGSRLKQEIISVVKRTTIIYAVVRGRLYNVSSVRNILYRVIHRARSPLLFDLSYINAIIIQIVIFVILYYTYSELLKPYLLILWYFTSIYHLRSILRRCKSINFFQIRTTNFSYNHFLIIIVKRYAPKTERITFWTMDP